MGRNIWITICDSHHRQSGRFVAELIRLRTDWFGAEWRAGGRRTRRLRAGLFFRYQIQRVDSLEVPLVDASSDNRAAYEVRLLSPAPNPNIYNREVCGTLMRKCNSERNSQVAGWLEVLKNPDNKGLFGDHSS